jgi:hypothetical protein
MADFYPSWIGGFSIGQSPIEQSPTGTGPDYPPIPVIDNDVPSNLAPFDWRATIMSQFANSPRITALIDSLWTCIDQKKNLDAFFNLVWNIDTAQGYGLDVWGRIVVVDRVLKLPTSGLPLGFYEETYGVGSFGQGVFYSGDMLTTNYRLSNDAYRKLVLAKAMANITDGSITSINAILMLLFGARGNCYVQEMRLSEYLGFGEAETLTPNYIETFGFARFYSGEPLTTMTMSYTFEFQPDPVELAIIEQSGVLPKPTGVKAFINII